MKKINAEDVIMKNEYAVVSWAVEDVLEAAAEEELDVSESFARDILGTIEDDIGEAMAAAGWEVIYEKLNEDERNGLIKRRS